MVRKRKGRGSSNSQAAKFPAKNVNENIQTDSGAEEGKESTMDVADDQKIKGTDPVETACDIPAAKVDKDIEVGKDSEKATSDIYAATPSTAKVDKDDIIEVGRDSEKATSSNEADKKPAGNKSRRKELIKYETKTNPEPTTGVPILESPESAESNRRETLVAKRKLAPAKAFFVCAPPIQYPNDELCLSIGASKLKDIDERKRTLDPKASKTQQELSSITDPKEGTVLSQPFLQYFKDNDEKERHFDLKASKSQQPLSSEIERTATFEMEGFQIAVLELFLIDLVEKAQKTDLETLKTQLRFSSESSLVLKFFQFIQVLDRKLKTENASKTAQELYSEIEEIITETGFEGNLSKMLLEHFRNFFKQKLNSEIQASNIPPELSSENEITGTDSKTEVSESMSLLQDPELEDIDEKIRSLDLNASKLQQDPSSEDQFKLSEPITQEYEEVINLKRDASLNFEFDEHGEKRILVNDALYVVDGKRKVTFNIGDGKAQLSFIDNKVFISTRGGQIDCSMQKNQIVFTLADSTLKSDPLPERPRATEFQTSLEDSVNNFFTNVRTTCDEFKNSFLKSLKK